MNNITIESLYSDKELKKYFIENGNINLPVITHYLHTKDVIKDVNNPYKNQFYNITSEFFRKVYNKNMTEKDINELVDDGFFNFFNTPFQSQKKYKFTFIDLFAGIGGFRISLENLGGKCIYSSEWDNESRKTYIHNFGDYPFGDITTDETKSYVPDNFDILCGGFPCQSFSIAGKRGGFEDTRGTLFFDVAEIIKEKQPRVVFLENVKGLRSHDKGNTLKTILNVLRDDLGYFVPDPQVLNSKDFGVPQNRERILIVGFHKDTGVNEFAYPIPSKEKVSFGDIKEKEVVPTKYYLSTQYYQTLINHKNRHEGKGNGFGFQIIKDTEISNSVVCGGMGRERNLVYDDRIVDYTPTTKIKGEVNRLGIRKMTPREWSRLQGFPEKFRIVVSDSSSYKQFGNSVSIPVIQKTGEELVKRLLKNINKPTNVKGK